MRQHLQKMKTLELRPDRSQLKPTFDGYKLSLEPIPILRANLTGSSQPNRIRPSESQFSHLHALVFGLQNFLVRDAWAPGNCYFIDQNRRVCWVQYNDTTGRLMPVLEVFRFDLEESEEVYNFSLLFLSEKYALVADGRKVLYLVDTGDRRKGAEWKVKLTCTTPEWPGCCILEDARFEIINGERQIHAIGARVTQEDESFKTVLVWIKAVQNDSNQPWKFHSSQVLKGAGYPYYCALEPKSKGLMIASDKPFKFNTSADEIPMEEDVPDETSCPSKAIFTWTQTTEDITIKIPKSDGVEYQVSNHNLKLKVTGGETTIIDGENWFAGIDADLTSWTNESDEIHITLFKANPGLMWPLLFPGAPEEFDNRVEPIAQPASNLTSQLEECDFGVDGDGTTFTIERLEEASLETTHRAVLGGNIPLFRVTLRPGFPDAIALRSDVDACLWLQQTGEDWSLRHEGTLHAFGYVQASKRQRKFMSCSPDVNYAVICEAQRHIFIYKGSYNSAGGLRNRNGPQVSIGQQKVISLEGSSEILGICCENNYTILLLETEVLVLQLSIEE